MVSVSSMRITTTHTLPSQLLNNIDIFETQVLKDGFKHREMNSLEKKDYNANYCHDCRGDFHPRYFTTGDGQKIQVFSMYTGPESQFWHDKLIQNYWIEIKPIYQIGARSYIRFIDENVTNIFRQRLKIETTNLNIKKYLNYHNRFKDTKYVNAMQKYEHLLSKAKDDIHYLQKTIAEYELMIPDRTPSLRYIIV